MSTQHLASPCASACAGTTPLLDRLERSYNLLPPSHRDAFFLDLVIEAIHAVHGPRRVLDIGCGEGVGTDPGRLSQIRAACEDFRGVDPDTSIRPPEGVFDGFEHARLEDAQLEDESVDVAYSCMVMEHVQDPAAFMAGVFRILRPGGAYLFLTVNGAHYFTRMAGLLRRLRIDEHVLRVVRPRQVVDEYHHPTAYRFNTPRQIDGTCGRLGFEPPRYVFAEHDGARCYFPGPTAVVWHALTWKRRVLRNPRALLELIAVVRKPAQTGAARTGIPAAVAVDSSGDEGRSPRARKGSGAVLGAALRGACLGR